ncbi:MAG: hypothetical protein WC919_00840 [Candidatus Paceibacterota bacterium]|jgi:hypothetical protein
MFVIVRNQMDYQNEILAIRSTKQLTLVRIAEIAEQMVKEAQDTEPLEIDADDETGEVYLTRAEFENEDPLYTLSYVVVEDVG